MRILVADDEMMARDNLVEVLKEIDPEMEVVEAANGIEAVQLIKEFYDKGTPFDVAMLDIQMPQINGLETAQTLKSDYPSLNVIFVTAFMEYAYDATKLFVSGYLMKPYTKEEVQNQLTHLRFPVKAKKSIRIQCFGNFEVFYEDRPIKFARKKAKELLALLVDQNGAAISAAEVCAILYEESDDEEKNKTALRGLAMELRKSLKECGAEDIFVHSKDAYSIQTEKVECDYYGYLKGNPDDIAKYQDEYMTQYSWAERTLGSLMNI